MSEAPLERLVRGAGLLALASLLFAITAAVGALLGDGWPNNHEGLSVFERAEAFRRAFLSGDLFPLW
ncbi:MAG: hypothetical protein WBV82_32900, partial [Myxococcaceae bacterium]